MKRNKLLLFSVVLVLAILAASLVAVFASSPTTTTTTTNSTEKPQDALARVNKTYIVASVYDRYLQRQVERIKKVYEIDFNAPENKDKLVNLKKQTLEQLMKNELLLQACYELGVTVTEEDIKVELGKIKATYPDEDTFSKILEQMNYTMDELRSDIILQLSYEKLAGILVQNEKVTDEELKQFYQDNIRKFSQEEQVHGYHILVDSKEKAEEILKELNKGADFGEMAKKNSTCPSSAQGGDLGFFGRGAMVAEFEKAAFALELNKLSAPVQTEFGWHIIKVTEKKDAVVKTFEEMKPEVEKVFLEQIKFDSATKYIDKKWSEADIEYFVNFTS